MQNKIDKKYSIWIWLGMIFASFVANIYSIYIDALDMAQGVGGLTIAIEIIVMILVYGIVPALVTYFVAYVSYIILARRHANYISRTDFCYWIMIFVSAERVLSGIINGFSILSEPMNIVTTTILDVTLLPCAMLVMYLLIAKLYNFNPVEKRNSFQVLSVIFFVLVGISVLSDNLTIVLLASDGEYSQELLSYLHELGYNVSALNSDIQVYSSVTAMVIYACWLIADIVLTYVFKKQAGEYQDEDTRDDFFARHPSRNEPYQRRDDVYATFEEFGDVVESDDDDKNDSVFDEFDI